MNPESRPDRLAALLERQVAWRPTGDALHPWRAEVDGARWRLRLNDFPEDPLYTLLIDDEPRGDFDDWPPAWHREG